MLQAGCQRHGDRHHRICGLQLRSPHLNHDASSRASAPWDRRIDRCPAGSFLGGFRTPATRVCRAAVAGRHPKPYTHSEVPEAGNPVRISSEKGRKRRLGQPAALGQLRAIVQPNCGNHFLRKSKQACRGGDGIHLATAKSRCRALFYPVRRFRS